MEALEGQTYDRWKAENARLLARLERAEAVAVVAMKHIDAADSWWGWLKEPTFPLDPDGSIEAQYRGDKKLVDDTHTAFECAVAAYQEAIDG